MGSGYMPDGLFAILLAESHKHRRSYRQLMLELVRDGLEKRYSWKCPHDKLDRKFSRKVKMFYCKGCGTFFERIQMPKYSKEAFEYRPLQNTWEIDAITKRPMGPLEADLK